MMWSPDQIASNPSRSTRRTLSISAAMAGTPWGEAAAQTYPNHLKGHQLPLMARGQQTHYTLTLRDSGHAKDTLSVANQ